MTDAATPATPKAKRQRNPVTPSTKGKSFTKMKLADGLTVQEEAYARARAYGMSQKDAVALISGGESTARSAGSHMEKKPHVKARIEDLRRQMTERAVEKASLDRAWVLQRLMKVADRCMQEEPVLDRQGNKTGEYRFDSAGANRSLELLGKELGMFTERKDRDDNPLASLNDSQLTGVIAELASQVGLGPIAQGTEAAEGSQSPWALPPVSEAG